jgi:CoA:oxalate CoA-transferase
VILLAAGVPVGAVNDFGRILEHPQVKARGVLADLDHPVAGKVQVIAPFFRMSKTPGSARTPAPLLGEHTEQVLREELGLGAPDIERLRQIGAIGKRRSPTHESVRA